MNWNRGIAMAATLSASLGMIAAADRETSGAEDFGKTSDGTPVKLFTLNNKNGMVAKLITIGATLTELHVPDKSGKTADVVLGFDTVAGYESDDNQYFGGTVGRVANRIAKGNFTLDGTEYKLAINNEPNHLHGGPKKSLSKVVWEGKPINGDSSAGVEFNYVSPAGEEGYPGKVVFRVTYTLTDKNELRIDYSATATHATPINLTHHSYFNLSGAGSESVLDHELTVAAERYTPTDDTLIPTGKLADVADTPLDFRKPAKLSAKIDELVKTPAKGFDHNFVLTKREDEPTLAARLRDPKSGRVMTVLTTQPGLQVYSGNFLKGQKGKGGKIYPQRSAICLETQHFPDSVNQKAFPAIIVQPRETYRHACVYAFSAE